MQGQHYGTQEVIRGCVRAGMLVKHKDQIWTASSNKKGKLALHTMRETTFIKDTFVEILLDGRGEPLGNYSREDYGLVYI